MNEMKKKRNADLTHPAAALSLLRGRRSDGSCPGSFRAKHPLRVSSDVPERDRVETGDDDGRRVARFNLSRRASVVARRVVGAVGSGRGSNPGAFGPCFKTKD